MPSGRDFVLGLNGNFVSSGQVYTATIEFCLGTPMNIAPVPSIPDYPWISRVDGIGWILMQTI